MRKFITILGILLLTSHAHAALRTETVEYKHGDDIFEGYLAYDTSVKGKRPGVLVVHEWKGVGPHVKRSCEKLAKEGYIAFAVDMYGKGIRPQSNNEAAQQAGIYKGDRSLMRTRALAGLEVLKNHKLTDTARLAAIGYCFGGTTTLELARSGADLKGVVSFHGGLDTPNPQEVKNIKAKILVLHGADDPYVQSGEVLNFQEEMREAKADWQFVSYSGAVHSFTNPDAGNNPAVGAAYNPQADERSWEAMKMFFKEIFK